MKTIFLKEGSRLIPNPDCDWVFRGQGRPSQKYDGVPIHVTAEGQAISPKGFESALADALQTVNNRFWLDFPEDYELVGPDVKGNPYYLDRHQLWRHGSAPLKDLPVELTPETLFHWFQTHNATEGIVWKKGDKYAKVDVAQLGFHWPPQSIRDFTPKKVGR